MATNYPTSLDTFVNPTSNDSLNSPSHSQQHTNLNDAMVAVQTKLGVGNANKVGMDLIVAQTIGTAVSSVTVNNVFSSSYDNYYVTITGGVGSTTSEINLRIGGVSSSDYTVSFIYSSYASPSVSALGSSTSNAWSYVGANDTTAIHASFELRNPFLAKYTSLANAAVTYLTYAGVNNGLMKLANSYTDFTIYPASGTWTGGTIRVYGYRNS
jgi:hypothetical protein